MDDTPRSSKRRKLDTPKRTVSTPFKESSANRASGRLANRSVSYAHAQLEEDALPKRSGRMLKSVSNGSPAKRAVLPEVDIYDDFEGALSVAPATRPAHRISRTASRGESASTTDELQEAVATPERGKRQIANNAQSAGRSAFKSLVNGFKHGEADGQDELADEAATPSKRKAAARTRAASARKAATPRKRLTIPAGSDNEPEVQPVSRTATPSKLRSTRKATGTSRKQAETEDDEPLAATPSRRETQKPLDLEAIIPDTEDELTQRRLPSVKKKTPSTKRRANRTDHVNNRDDADPLTNGILHEDDTMDVDGNSLLGSVLDPTEPSPFNKPSSAQKEKLPQPIIYGNLPAGRELDLLKTVVLERITGKRASPLIGLDEEYKSVHQLVEHTVTAGEGNSMLVIGARGSGKTALVNKVLSEVSKDNGGDYHVVRLNGFIHTDDKIALREIWRQLGKEMDIEEDGSGPGKNYADTLTTLLALLSHPSEQTGELTDQVAKAVVFIIDEFDLFAQHPRQTLLYNLFDIAQSRKAPIAVLGLTTRIDVTNSLEKRVKSRFSHRYVHLSLAKTFTAFQEISQACLTIRPEHLSMEEQGILKGGAKGTPAKKGKKESNQDVLSEWNANIDKLFSSPAFLTQHLAPHFYHTKSVPTVLNSFFLPTATLGPDVPFIPTNLLAQPDSKLSLIPSLPTLGLALLIAATRLDIIHDSDTCNFNMAYDEYVNLASRARIQSAAGGMSASGSVSKVWSKDVARREWENLVELGLVMPVIQGQAGGFGMVKCDVALEEIGAVLGSEKGVDKQLERWCKSI